MSDDEHMERPLKRNSVIAPSSNYADNCKSGFNRKSFSQAHHILSSTCMARRMDDYPANADTRNYLEDCLHCATWDLNDEHNLIGLPTNALFKDTNGVVSPELPSHQVDHHGDQGYIKEVKKWLKDNLWDTLQHKGDIHKVDVTKIETQLKGCSNFYRNLLTNVYPKRPMPAGGVKKSWDLRHDPVKGKKWYQPFSMSSKPSPRNPGAPNKDLTSLFKKLAG